ncbi:Kinase, NEK [Giardia muris]|uniref:Kinase, NEK n=1 Tax=Giardia muris TaxID=5742 RepID=A0A4Z1SUM5_GIAMU|nr:Kinase, NEK [Giardia muris]|eukprot:TNJ29556.1 Kinase, NEK [Giardia muris]
MGLTQLIRAATRGDLRGVRKHMREAGAQDEDGWTALIHAAHSGHLDCVRELVGVEAGKQTTHGFTALMHAAQEGFPDCVEVLMPSEARMCLSDGQTALMSAACKGHVACVRILKAKEARMRTDTGDTALIQAVINGHVECVRELLEMEAGLRDKDGFTALMLAAQNGDAACVEALRKAEATMAKDSGWTALMSATSKGHAACVRLLLDREGELELEGGWTALMTAAQKGHLECAELLLSQAGRQTVDPFGDYPSGISALMLASINNHLGVVELLTPFERDLFDSEGHDAIWHAGNTAQKPNPRVVHYLKKSILSSDKPVTPMITSPRPQPTKASSGLFEVETALDQRKEVGPSNGDIISEDVENYQYLKEESLTLTPLASSRTGAGITTSIQPETTKLQPTKKAYLYTMQDTQTHDVEGVGSGGRSRTGLESKESMSILLPNLPAEMSKKYTIVSCIGQGAYGSVYAAENAMGWSCAIKVVDYRWQQDGTRRSLATELTVLPKLRHEGILAYQEVFDDKASGSAYIVTELCAKSLADELQHRQELGANFSDGNVWICLRQMADGLAYLHGKKLLHRDLKPANVLLTEGRCVLADFGLIRSVDQTLALSSVVGTPFYMAPEIFASKPCYSNPADVWSLGVIAYELCTGRRPFDSVVDIIQTHPAPIENRPPALVNLITRMMDRNPATRPSAKEVLRIAEANR